MRELEHELSLLLLLVLVESYISPSLSVVVVLQLSVVVRGLKPYGPAVDVLGVLLFRVPIEECSEALSSKLPVDRLLQHENKQDLTHVITKKGLLKARKV